MLFYRTIRLTVTASWLNPAERFSLTTEHSTFPIRAQIILPEERFVFPMAAQPTANITSSKSKPARHSQPTRAPRLKQNKPKCMPAALISETCRSRILPKIRRSRKELLPTKTSQLIISLSLKAQDSVTKIKLFPSGETGTTKEVMAQPTKAPSNLPPIQLQPSERLATLI